MNFVKYPSLVNHYAIGKEKRILNLYDEKWVATKKIHGANISIVINKNGEQGFAKRSGFIAETGDKQFNRFVKLAKEKHELIEQIKQFLNWEEVTQVHAFGEYFGSSVQKMDYDLNHNNEVDIKIFNVVLEYGNGDIHYVVGREILENYINAEFLTPVTEYRTLRDFLKEEPSDKSIYGGISEGQVYQPIHGYIFNDNFRFIGVKHKTDIFAEVSKKKSNPKPKVNHTPEFLALVEDLGMFVTENRLNNVLSHGEYELIPQNIGKIMLSFKEDAVNEFIEDSVGLESMGVRKSTMEKADILKAISSYDGAIAHMIKEAIKSITEV